MTTLQYNEYEYFIPSKLRHPSAVYLDIFGDTDFRIMNQGVTNRIMKLGLADTYRKNKALFNLQDRLEARDSFTGALKDNWARLTFLQAIERYLVVRQTSLFSATTLNALKDSPAANMNAINSQGVLGPLRGALLSVASMMAAPFEAYNISNGDFGCFMTSLLALETVLYPLDTLRVTYQADTTVQTRSGAQAFNNIKPGQLFSGLPYKLAFASIYGLYLTRAGSFEGVQELYNLPLLVAAYPFLTLKSICQVTLTDANPVNNLLGSATVAEKVLRPEGLRVLYRGFVPFAAVSLLFPLYLPKLWSKETQEQVMERLAPKQLQVVAERNPNNFNF